MGYHPVLAAIALQEKNNIISNTTNEDQKIEVNINVREIYLMRMFLSGAYNFRYKKLNKELKKYIMGMYGYPQDLLGGHETSE